MSDTAKSTRKIKKRTLAISAAAEEIPVKPNRPATMATTKNIKAYLSMENLLLILSGGVSSSPRAGWRIIFIRGVEWIMKGETADALGKGEKGLGGVYGPTLGSRGR
jgi:hypothetical protein